ncbi:MAG: hypothetical protein PHQ18_01235 [Patescibacteria group bacterium]|nr:hypothetical protein [Patescibacteria group bacterium]
MGKPKYHYIPNKSYLSNFIDDKGHIWVLKSEKEIYRSNPINEFKETEFYPKDIEEVLHQIEDGFLEIYKNKISKFKKLTEKERVTLSVFVASFMQRVKPIIEHSKQNWEKIRERVNELQKSIDDDKIKVEQIPHIFDTNKKNSFKLEELDEFLTDYKKHHSYSMLKIILTTHKYINKMNISFLYIEEDELNYIGSDNPFCMTAPLREQKYGINSWGSDVGLAHRDVEISIPLSSKITLFASWMYDLPNYKKADKDTIEQLNFRVMRQSPSLFCCDKKVLEKIKSNSSK